LIAFNGTTFGVNPSGISYWHRELTFVDVMKTSHADWTPQTHTDYTWNTGESVALRSDGYAKSLGVDQAVGTMMLRYLDENAEDGTYVVRWDGGGVLECSLNVKSIVRGAGFMKCEMDFTTEFNNGLFVRIEWTNPFDPVRNVRVFLPGFDHGAIRSSNLSASAAGPWSVLPFHPRLLVRNIPPPPHSRLSVPSSLFLYSQCRLSPLLVASLSAQDFLQPFPILRFIDYSQANSYASG